MVENEGSEIEMIHACEKEMHIPPSERLTLVDFRRGLKYWKELIRHG